jgi:hypothetical protein
MSPRFGCLRGRAAAGLASHSVRWLWLLAPVLSIGACNAQPTPWTVLEILRDVEPELRQFDGVTQPIREARILMWQVERDRKNGFVDEEVLLWTASDTAKQEERWALVHAFRHPSDDNVWHRSVSYSETKNEALVPHTRLGYKQFSTPPNAIEVCAFLRLVRGPVLDTGFDHAAGDFPKATWRKLMGGESPCGFSGKVEQR